MNPSNQARIYENPGNLIKQLSQNLFKKELKLFRF